MKQTSAVGTIKRLTYSGIALHDSDWSVSTASISTPPSPATEKTGKLATDSFWGHSGTLAQPRLCRQVRSDPPSSRRGWERRHLKRRR